MDWSKFKSRQATVHMRSADFGVDMAERILDRQRVGTHGPPTTTVEACTASTQMFGDDPHEQYLDGQTQGE